MRARDRRQIATCRVLVVGLQVPALLLLQSCKNDQTEPAKREAEDQQQRAVFGSAPERARSEIRPGTPEIKPQPKVEAARSHERARTAEQVSSKSRSASGETERPPEKDLRKPSRSHSEVTVASNRPPPEPAAERLLHYEPPGSKVGDPGELTPRIREPQISSSVNSIRELIRRWADTLLTRDLPGHMSLYVPTLERFNGLFHVAQENVRVSKQRLLPGFAGVRRFEIYDFRLLSSRDGSSIAEFRIESDAVARGVSGWYRLQLRQIDGQWKIYGEEKLESVSRRGGH
jgi:hypothetical protein